MDGCGAGAGTALHLIVEVGIGGMLLVDGVPADGARGTAGDDGRTPSSDRRACCPCGVRGCWDLAIDGRALAWHLDEPAPDDPYAYADEPTWCGDGRVSSWPMRHGREGWATPVGVVRGATEPSATSAMQALATDGARQHAGSSARRRAWNSAGRSAGSSCGRRCRDCSGLRWA
ncbi:ROK family protein [Kribbella endophytica]